MEKRGLSLEPNLLIISMISSRPTLQVRRFVVFAQDGSRAYDETFHPGVNIIRGSNSSGKSTIMNLLYYSLGGDYSSWSQAATQCRTVVVEILVNGVFATLKRNISSASMRPMMIYLGNMDEALRNSEDGWKVYPYRYTDNTFSFSRVLFDLLHYPEVRSDAGDTNITMHQILRLMFIDQESKTDSLFRQDIFDYPLTREAVSELLLGIYDNELYNLRLQEKDLQAIKKDKEAEYRGLRKLYQQSAETIDIHKATSLINEKEDALSELEREITEKASQTSYNVPRKKGVDVVAKIDCLNILKRDINRLKESIHNNEADITDSKLFIESLNNKLEQLSDSILTRQSLGELPLTHCPQCLSPLQPSNQKGVCSLCHQPIDADQGFSYASRIQQEIRMQISESTKIIEKKERRLQQYKDQLAGKIAEAEQVQRDINLSTKNSKPAGQEELECLYELRGSLKQEILYLKKQKLIAERFTQLGEEIAEKNKELDLINQRIEQLVTLQHSNQKSAVERIQECAAYILRNDLPRQSEFVNAIPSEIDVNFRANSMALKGQFNYSASSNVFLKNAIRFAIFFASLGFGFIRYPRFIACDNMEDKGMEKERSQNFQKLLVMMSSKVPKDNYQMIFTTSMIAPELNTNEFCVGDEYFEVNKSLKLK